MRFRHFNNGNDAFQQLFQNGKGVSTRYTVGMTTNLSGYTLEQCKATKTTRRRQGRNQKFI